MQKRGEDEFVEAQEHGRSGNPRLRVETWGTRLRGLRLSGGELLYGAEDLGHLAVERGVVEVEDGAAWMEDDVDRAGQEAEMPTDERAEPPLDPVALMSLAEHLADGEADARGAGVGVAHGLAVGPKRWPERDEEAHLLRELLAARLIGLLVVGVFAEAVRLGEHGVGC